MKDICVAGVDECPSSHFLIYSDKKLF